MVRWKAVILSFLLLNSCVSTHRFERHEEETQLRLQKMEEKINEVLQKMAELIESSRTEEGELRERIAELMRNIESLEEDIRTITGELERKVHFMEMNFETIQKEIEEIKGLVGEEYLFFKGKKAFEEKKCEEVGAVLKEYQLSYHGGKYLPNLYFIYGKCLDDSQNKEEALKIYISLLKEFPSDEKFCEVLHRSIEILKVLNRPKELSAFEKEKKIKCPPEKP
jgi:TolA-binding protein